MKTCAGLVCIVNGGLRLLGAVLLAGLTWLPPAAAQPVPSACSATLTPSGSTLRLRLPYLQFQGQGLTAELDLVPSADGQIWLRVASYQALADTTAFAACPQPYLSSGFVLDIPEVIYGSAAYSATLQYVAGGLGTDASVLMFKVLNLSELDYLRGSRSYAAGLTIAKGRTLVIANAAASGVTTIDVQGDFICEGEVDIWDAAASVRINVTGNAKLACGLRFLRAADANTLTVVAGATLNVQRGFVLPATGHVIVSDSASLVRTPSAYLGDAITDDGSTPSIMPVSDTTAARATATPALQRVRPLANGACDASRPHVLEGSFAPPVHRTFLPQDAEQGPVVLAAWLQCDVVVRGVDVMPPVWDAQPTSGRADRTAAKGRKGMTLNLRSEGKLTFAGNSTFRLMDGGDGQSKTITGDPAVATAGDGGESGDLKVAAAGGIAFAEGARLTIIPGRGGAGGGAIAIGKDGVKGCPGTRGASATATGGKGADARKTLRARGFDPTGKVFVGDVVAGNGGLAHALGGRGGDGNPGKCNGGNGGAASATAGKGGDASFRYSGSGSVTAASTAGGKGADAFSSSGRGGDGGNQATRCLAGGNGGDGGASTARAGRGGSGSVPGADGATSARTGLGDGGVCGNFNSTNGAAGAWAEFIGTTATNSGMFTPGQRDCKCVTNPRMALSVGELSFTHLVGVTQCPQTIGTVTILNTGDGSFSFAIGALPPWLSASRTSGNAGDQITFRFTCTGWTPSMSTSVRITGTNTDTGQPLDHELTLPVSGTAR